MHLMCFFLGPKSETNYVKPHHLHTWGFWVASISRDKVAFLGSWYRTTIFSGLDDDCWATLKIQEQPSPPLDVIDVDDESISYVRSTITFYMSTKTPPSSCNLNFLTCCIRYLNITFRASVFLREQSDLMIAYVVPFNSSCDTIIYRHISLHYSDLQ